MQMMPESVWVRVSHVMSVRMGAGAFIQLSRLKQQKVFIEMI